MAQASMTGPGPKIETLELRKAKRLIRSHWAGPEPHGSLCVPAYPFSVGGSFLAQVKVAFFMVMLFVPPPGKHEIQHVRRR